MPVKQVQYRHSLDSSTSWSVLPGQHGKFESDPQILNLLSVVENALVAEADTVEISHSYWMVSCELYTQWWYLQIYVHLKKNVSIIELALVAVEIG